MWYEIKIKADEYISEAINSILYEMDASGILIENSEDEMFTEGYQGDWDYFGIDVASFEEGYFIKAYVEFEANDTSDRIPRIDYSCMSREITTLSGESDFTKVNELYGDIKSWMGELKSKIGALTEYGFDISNIEISHSLVEEIDYVNKWKEEYKPFQIIQDITICPTWLMNQFNAQSPDEEVIFLDPGIAFGSGTHESTELCAALMKKYAPEKGYKMYDIGCGSGILSIIGKRLGFKHIVGIDIDEKAVAISRENAILNGETDIEFVQGDLLEKLETPADFVVANIIADVIINMAPDLSKVVAKSGYFIGSGIINERLESVVEALKEHGFLHIESVSKNEWSAVIFRLS